MNIELFKTLISVAKNKSITKATEELLLTQPAVTKQIKFLEQEYGIKLFERKNKEFVLTQDGHILLDYAYRIINIYNESFNTINEMQGKLIGTLRMGVNLTLGIYILPKLIKLFCKEHPELKVEMFLDNTDHIVNAVKRNEVNFGFVGLIVKDPSIAHHLFFQDRVKVVIGSHTKINKKTISWKELKSLPFIGREKGSDIRTSYEQWLKKKDIQLTPKIVLNSTEAIKICVQQGLGFSFLPWCTVQQEVTYGLLKVISIPYFDVRQNFYICHFRGKKFSKVEKSFLKFLFDEIETKGILSSSSEEDTF